MNMNNQAFYAAPEVTVIELCVEQGFALSPFAGESEGQTGNLFYDESTNDFDL